MSSQIKLPARFLWYQLREKYLKVNMHIYSSIKNVYNYKISCFCFFI